MVEPQEPAPENALAQLRQEYALADLEELAAKIRQPKWRLFAEHYIACGFDAVAAYERVGYRAGSRASAWAAAGRLLGKPEIKRYIHALVAQHLRDDGTRAAQRTVVEELSALGFARYTDYGGWDENGNLTLVASEDLTDDQVRAIKKFKHTRSLRYDKDGEVVSETINTEMELHDKITPLRLLGEANGELKQADTAPKVVFNFNLGGEGDDGAGGRIIDGETA